MSKAIQLLEQVNDGDSLVAFLEALAEESDIKWENHTIRTYLLASAALARDTRQTYEKTECPWKRIASMLMAGAVYE